MTDERRDRRSLSGKESMVLERRFKLAVRNDEALSSTMKLVHLEDRGIDNVGIELTETRTLF